MYQRLVAAAVMAGLTLVASASLCRADDDKKTDKEAKKAFLGVEIRGEDDGKLVVGNVIPNGPADKAGLKTGDVIVKVGKVEPKDTETLLKVLSESKPGDKLPITIKRDDKEQTITVTLGERPKDMG
jgi:S1-C subfamily serine protease